MARVIWALGGGVFVICFIIGAVMVVKSVIKGIEKGEKK